MCCLYDGCDITYKLEEVSQVVQPQQLSDYVKALTRLKEKIVLEENNKYWNEKYERLKSRVSATLKEHKEYIINELLFVKCPKCFGPWELTEGCSAMTCKCGTKFCGLCLLICLEAPLLHKHVADCSMNIWQKGTYYVSNENVFKAHKLSMERRVKEYFANKEKDPAMIRQLKVELCDHFKNIGINL